MKINLQRKCRQLKMLSHSAWFIWGEVEVLGQQWWNMINKKTETWNGIKPEQQKRKNSKPLTFTSALVWMGDPSSKNQNDIEIESCLYPFYNLL